MTKKTIVLQARDAYETPSSQVVLMQAENGLCLGSQEGFEGEDDYIFSAPGFSALDSGFKSIL